MLSGRSGINGQSLIRGELTEQDWDSLIRSVDQVSDYAMHIDDNAGINLFEMKAIAKKMKAQGKAKLIIIDYLQLMGGDRKAENRQNEVSELSRGLKKLARDLELPVIALSQLSRAVEQRSGKKRPMLSDLRESGSLEQDADMVLMLYRPEAYGEAQVTINNVDLPADGMAEIIIAKQRKGPTGSFWLKFEKTITRFVEFEATQEWDGRE
jgi:replicative DNA helicase